MTGEAYVPLDPAKRELSAHALADAETRLAGGADSVKESARRYRVTRASVVWIVAALLLVPYELLCVIRNVDGGPLSHVMWWAYGDRGSLRWWLLSCGFVGWSVWCCWHFALRWPNQWHLIALVLIGLIAGAIGYLVTH